MRTKKKIFIGSGALLLVMFIGVFIFTVLGGNLGLRGITTDKTGNESVAPGAPTEVPDKDYGEQGGKGAVDGDKVIGTYTLNFETLEFSKSIAYVDALVLKYKGYVEYSEIYNMPTQAGKIFKYARYTLRIPKEQVMAFNTEFKLNSHLTSENSNVQNITKYYNDTTARLNTLETQLARLNELYGKAELIQDIISIESRINEILYQIESLKGELQYLDERINYSTVSVYIQEVAKLTTGESVQASFGERLSKALKDSIAYFQEAMINFVILLIYVIPFIVVLGILGYGVAKVVKVTRKKLPQGSGKDSAELPSDSKKS